MIGYVTEIVKSLPNWIEQGLISNNLCQEYSTTLGQLVSVTNDPDYINFYFEIFFALMNRTLGMYIRCILLLFRELKTSHFIFTSHYRFQRA